MSSLVSIIVPVYNVERYLAECIDSLLLQTYKNIEIILVDDGSSDSSGKICDQYSISNLMVKVIHKKNEGAGKARNSGIEIATGKFVMFVDSDDYLDKNFIEDLMNKIILFNADTVISGFKKVDDLHNVIYKKSYGIGEYSGKECYDKCFLRMLGSKPGRHDGLKMAVWGSIYSMDIIIGNNLRFVSERELISEDLIFNEEYYKFSKKVVIVDNLGYNYRYNPSSITQTYKENRFKMINELYVELEKRIKLNFRDSNEAINRLQCHYFINLKSCMVQEKQIRSGKNSKKQRAKLKEICSDSLVQHIVKECPITQFEIKQKVFIYLIKNKMVRLIAFLIEKNIII